MAYSLTLALTDRISSLEKERFGDRLTYSITSSGQTQDIKAIGLLIQPLAENALKYGIANDEEMARSRLKRLLAQTFPEITIVGEATDGLTAQKIIEGEHPDIVFLDIEMPGLNGLEVAASIPKKTFIIFVTAFNQYALDAFKTMAIDYLLKPIDSDDLQRALAKINSLSAPPDLSVMLNQLLNISRTKKTSSRLLVKVGDSVKFIPYSEILCFEADQKYTTVFTKATTYISDLSLKDLEETLPSDTFLRIHRKHIVNILYISECKRLGDRKFEVILTVPINADLIVSRYYLEALQKI